MSTVQVIHGLSTVHCPLSAVRAVWFAYCPVSTVWCPPSTARYPDCPLPTVQCSLSSVRWLLTAHCCTVFCSRRVRSTVRLWRRSTWAAPTMTGSTRTGSTWPRSWATAPTRRTGDTARPSEPGETGTGIGTGTGTGRGPGTGDGDRDGDGDGDRGRGRGRGEGWEEEGGVRITHQRRTQTDRQADRWVGTRYIQYTYMHTDRQADRQTFR